MPLRWEGLFLRHYEIMCCMTISLFWVVQFDFLASVSYYTSDSNGDRAAKPVRGASTVCSLGGRGQSERSTETVGPLHPRKGKPIERSGRKVMGRVSRVGDTVARLPKGWASTV